jgi:hypothetical protein
MGAAGGPTAESAGMMERQSTDALELDTAELLAGMADVCNA